MIHSKESKFFFLHKIRRKQKLPIHFYQRVTDRFPCCTAEGPGGVITSLKLRPVMPAAEVCMKCSLYQFVSYMILALHSKSQTLGYFSLLCFFTLFTQVQDFTM